jgi:hypothetical protein
MLFARRSLVLLPTLLLLGACSSLGLTQTLEPQLADVRETRAELETDWNAVASGLDEVEAELDAFTALRVAEEAPDPASMREAIEVSSETTAEDVEQGKDEAEAAVEAWRGTLEGLDEDARGRAEAARASGARIAQQLRVELPNALREVTERAAEAAVEVAAIEAAADQIEPVAEDNPLMTDEDRAQLSRDHTELDREIQSLRDLANRIGRESTAYGARLAASATRFDAELDELARRAGD